MLTRTCLIALLFAVPAAASAQTPDEKLAFADHLYDGGEEAFALLEYKRFRFHHPQHDKADEIGLRVAVLYIGTLSDTQRAKATLTDINTDRARNLKQFIEAHEGDGALPTYFSAKVAEGRGNHNVAAERYGRIAQEYPQSPLAADAAYQRAFAMEQSDGANAASIDRYEQITRRYPDTEAARLAEQRLDALRQTADVPMRQFDPQKVANYAVKRDGYGRYRNRYDVAIEVPKSLDDDAIRATLEAALLEQYKKRRADDHVVRIEAYFSYPITEAGKVEWRPGQPAKYTIAERETEDVVKDVLIDIFRNR